MNKIYELFSREKSKLANNKLHDVLRDNSIPVSNKLELIPAMTFWIMGFKDAMERVRYDNPKNDLEETVNVHGNEDSYHWKWFLKDLNTLNQAQVNYSTTDFTSYLFSDEVWATRDLVYKVFRYIKQYEEPEFRIMLIEALETGYGLFAEDMTPIIEEADLYQSLEFFGKVHNDAEAEHEMEDIAEEEENMDKLVASLSSEQLKEMEAMLINLFEGLNAMHACYADQVLKANTASA